MSDDDPAVNRFRELISEFKRPYVNELERSSESSQDPGILQECTDQIDTLFRILTMLVVAGGNNTSNDVSVNSVFNVFEKNGVFAELRKNSALRKPFLRVLQIDLKMYPFTIDTGHIRTLEKRHVESHQRDEPPNLEETVRVD